MSLENLLKIGQLKRHPPDRAEVQKLLAAADRNLADANLSSISPETAFDCAYKAAMQSALGALVAHGYRPSTNVPGHQATTIQTLTHTIGLSPERMTVLDKLRRKRNLNDYTGADLDEDSARVCAEEARRLLADVRAWLAKTYPQLAD